MDQNFRKRLQKTLYCGELESEHCPLALTELAVEYFQDLAPHSLSYVDLQSAAPVTSQDTVSPSSVTMSMMYAKRLQRKRPDYISKMSSSDLFIISMMMASKYLYDEGVEEEVFNDEWAKNTGLETDEVNTMEMDFLDALDWEMYIKKDDFDRAILSIEKSVALREGLKRGWFTYTDMHLLLDDTWTNLSGLDIGLEWLQVMVVSSAAYFTGIMTMVGSTVLVTNTCAALSSSGLLPVLLPSLLVTDSPLPAFTPVPSLCPSPQLDSLRDVVPSIVGPATNETRLEVEGNENSRPEGGSWMPGQNVVDTILSQLMAVLTLKSHLAQFVYAVSDNYISQRDRNHSEKKTSKHYPTCPFEGEDEAKPDDQEMPIANAGMLHLLGMEESSAELDWIVGSCCMDCRKSKAYLHFGITPTGSLSGQYHEKKCWKCSGLNGWEWTSGSTDWQCHDLCQRYNCRPEGQSCDRDWNQGLASMYSLFPDITIGFSTSMPPPVYAT